MSSSAVAWRASRVRQATHGAPELLCRRLGEADLSTVGGASHIPPPTGGYIPDERLWFEQTTWWSRGLFARMYSNPCEVVSESEYRRRRAAGDTNKRLYFVRFEWNGKTQGFRQLSDPVAEMLRVSSAATPEPAASSPPATSAPAAAKTPSASASKASPPSSSPTDARNSPTARRDVNSADMRVPPACAFRAEGQSHPPTPEISTALIQPGALVIRQPTGLHEYHLCTVTHVGRERIYVYDSFRPPRRSVSEVEYGVSVGELSLVVPITFADVRPTFYDPTEEVIIKDPHRSGDVFVRATISAEQDLAGTRGRILCRASVGDPAPIEVAPTTCIPAGRELPNIMRIVQVTAGRLERSRALARQREDQRAIGTSNVAAPAPVVNESSPWQWGISLGVDEIGARHYNSFSRGGITFYVGSFVFTGRIGLITDLYQLSSGEARIDLRWLSLVRFGPSHDPLRDSHADERIWFHHKDGAMVSRLIDAVEMMEPCSVVSATEYHRRRDAGDKSERLFFVHHGRKSRVMSPAADRDAALFLYTPPCDPARPSLHHRWTNAQDAPLLLLLRSCIGHPGIGPRDEPMKLAVSFLSSLDLSAVRELRDLRGLHSDANVLARLSLLGKHLRVIVGDSMPLDEATAHKQHPHPAAACDVDPRLAESDAALTLLQAQHRELQDKFAALQATHEAASRQSQQLVSDATQRISSAEHRAAAAEQSHQVARDLLVHVKQEKFDVEEAKIRAEHRITKATAASLESESQKRKAEEMLRDETKRARTAEAALEAQMAESLKCSVCLDEPPALVYMPCGHFICCATCDAALPKRECPKCQSKIHSEKKVFL